MAQSIASSEPEFKLPSPERQEGGGFCGSGPSVRVEAQGRLFRAAVEGFGGRGGRTGGGLRGRVEEFSKASRHRLLERLARMDFAGMMSSCSAKFVTVTYPDDYPSARSSKEHLGALRRRIARRYGNAPMVWRLGVQGRGAPHYHFIVFGLQWISVSWLRASWGAIIGHTGGQRLQVDVQQVRSPKLVASYVARYEAKQEAAATAGATAQARADEAADAVLLDLLAYQAGGEEGEGTWDRPGRFWGVWNSDLFTWCPREEWSAPLGPWLYALKRVARRYWQGTNKEKGQGFMLFCASEQWQRLAASCLYAGA